MSKDENNQHPSDASKHQPYRIRLPGFMTDEQVGLGDVIKRLTSTVGIQPCGGCTARAVVLNRWLAFIGKPPS